MWIAVVTGGTFGVIAVRLAGRDPAAPARAPRRRLGRPRRGGERTMVAADLVRGIVLTPIAVAGLTGHLSIWAIAPAGFVVALCVELLLPGLHRIAAACSSDGTNVQRANGLVTATNSAADGRRPGDRGGAARRRLDRLVLRAERRLVLRLGRHPARASRLPARACRRSAAARLRSARASTRCGARPGLSVAIAMLALGTAVMTGVWTVGVAQLARDALGTARRPLAPPGRDRARDDLRPRALPDAPARARTRCGRAAPSWVLLLPGLRAARDGGRCRSHSPARSSSAWRPAPRSCS